MLRSENLEVTWAGDYSWRVIDADVPQDSPFHVVATIVAHEQYFDVVWIRGATVPAGSFPSLVAALDAIGEVTARRT